MNKLMIAASLALALTMTASPSTAEEAQKTPMEKVWDSYTFFGYTQSTWDGDRNRAAAIALTAPALLGDVLAFAFNAIATPFAIVGAAPVSETIGGGLPEPHEPQTSFAADQRACMETMRNNSRTGRIGKGVERYCNRLAAQGIRPKTWNWQTPDWAR